MNLTEKTKGLLIHLQDNPDMVHVGKDLTEEFGTGVYSLLTSLGRHGLVTHGELVERDFVNKAGVTVKKEYKTYVLTDEGRNHIVE